MAQLDWLKKIAVKIDSADNPIFKNSIADQEKFLDNLKESHNDIERSYNQYKCQMSLRGRFQTILLNICSLPIFLYYMIIGREHSFVADVSPDAVFMREGRPKNILPPSVLAKYNSIEYDPKVSLRLSKNDKRFIKMIIRRYPFSWLFILKILIKIGRYSYVLKSYNPSAIIVAAEYSFTSSILTMYCNEVWNVSHINVQHGEKLYTIWDSFFRFDVMYVWNEHYQHMLSRLKAEPKQFIVELPSSMLFAKVDELKKKVDYCYYLASENREQLIIIRDSLEKIRKRGKTVHIRPHPRYSDMSLINDLFDGFEIEDAKRVSIEDSIIQTWNAVAVFSTVLNQAYLNNTSIVIDDISNSSYFKKLKEMDYICLNYKYRLLSQVLGVTKEDEV